MPRLWEEKERTFFTEECKVFLMFYYHLFQQIGIFFINNFIRISSYVYHATNSNIRIANVTYNSKNRKFNDIDKVIVIKSWALKILWIFLLTQRNLKLSQKPSEKEFVPKFSKRYNSNIVETFVNKMHSNVYTIFKRYSPIRCNNWSEMKHVIAII